MSIEKRTMAAYRLSPKTIEDVQLIADENNMSQARVIDMVVAAYMEARTDDGAKLDVIIKLLQGIRKSSDTTQDNSEALMSLVNDVYIRKVWGSPLVRRDQNEVPAVTQSVDEVRNRRNAAVKTARYNHY